MWLVSVVERCSKKLRKAASVNGHCVLTEKITHDHVDDIATGMAELQRHAQLHLLCFFVT